MYDRPCNLSELLGQDLAHYHQSSRNRFSYMHKSDSHSNCYLFSAAHEKALKAMAPVPRGLLHCFVERTNSEQRGVLCLYGRARAAWSNFSTWTATSARQASHSYRSARRHALRHGLKYRVKVLHCSLLLLKSRSVRLNLINTEYQSREASVSAGLAHLEASLCGAALPDSAREKEK